MRMLKRKKGTITIKKQEVLNRVETLAYKRVESSMNDVAPETQSAVQADATEQMDATILSSLLDSRDSEVRGRLLYCLVASEDDLDVSNVSSGLEDYVYEVQVPEDFTRDRMVSACGIINDYFVYATLHDWYLQHGVPSTVDPTWLDLMLRKISGLFRFESFRKPLQPFGPAEPIGSDIPHDLPPII